MIDNQYYTIEEVAKTLRVTYLTVYRWIQSGKLPAYRAGKQYRISQKKLESFLLDYKRNLI